jgi:hypothetical protein
MHEVSLVLHRLGKRIIERGIVGVEPSSSLPFAIKRAADISDPVLLLPSYFSDLLLLLMITIYHRSWNHSVFWS